MNENSFLSFYNIFCDYKSCNSRDLFNKVSYLNFLSVDFLAPNTGYCCENQPVLELWSWGVGRGSGISLSVRRKGFMQSSHSHKSDRFPSNGFSQKSNQN